MPNGGPNVLVVLCDQLRAEALGCMGNEQVRTPTIDRLAEEGTCFERAYTTDPVCGPARATLQTGRYPHANGVLYNSLHLAEQPTLADELRDDGYHTGYVGKWHLDKSGRPGYVPPDRRFGYEFWAGFNRGHAHLRGHPDVHPDGSADWEAGYQPAIQTDRTIEFIEGHRADVPDRPFFAFLSWGPPHTPFEAPDEYSERYDPQELTLRPNVPDDWDTPELRRDVAEYYALITSLDDQLERLLATLEAEGIADETLVLFTSDHGDLLGSHGLERKQRPLEESVHVPLIARQPGSVAAGERVEELVSLLDVMPTLLSWCGRDVPDTVQGEDLSPLLRGEDRTPHPDGVYIEGRVPFTDAWRALRTPEELLVVDHETETPYYFGPDDPHQLENLAGNDESPQREQAVRETLVEQMYHYEDRDFMALFEAPNSE